MRSEFSSLDILNVETREACVYLNNCSYNDFKVCMEPSKNSQYNPEKRKMHLEDLPCIT